MLPIRGLVLDALRSDLSRWVPPAPPLESLEELAARLGRPARVAVARLDGIGDWVLTLPLITALQRSVLVSEVTLVAPPAVKGLLSGREGVDVRIVDLNTTFAPKTFDRRLGKLLATARPAQRAARRAGLAARGAFDLVVLPRWQVDRGYNARAWAIGTGALLSGHDPAGQPLAGAKERREGALLSLAVLDERPVVHEIERLRALMAALGLPQDIEPAYARDFFGTAAPSEPSMIVIHTGASEPKRVWPAHLWRELIELLLRDFEGTVTLIGAEAERQSHEQVIAGLGTRVITLAGTLPFKSLPDTISNASVFIGCDSGPAHIAASVGVPSVVLSCHPIGADAAHANSPERFGPWGTIAEVMRPRSAGPECVDRCVHSDAHCIAAIKPAMVSAAVARTLERANTRVPAGRAVQGGR